MNALTDKITYKKDKLTIKKFGKSKIKQYLRGMKVQIKKVNELITRNGKTWFKYPYKAGKYYFKHKQAAINYLKKIRYDTQ